LLTLSGISVLLGTGTEIFQISNTFNGGNGSEIAIAGDLNNDNK